MKTLKELIGKFFCYLFMGIGLLFFIPVLFVIVCPPLFLCLFPGMFFIILGSLFEPLFNDELTFGAAIVRWFESPGPHAQPVSVVQPRRRKYGTQG